jgi:hypothetical protein
MSAIVSALDNFTPSQSGWNGTVEYTWSHNIKERILQLSFQLTRTKNEETINNLADVTGKILKELKGSYQTQNLSYEEYVNYLSVMFCMIGQTRDIVDGKGEYKLSYMLLNVWYNYYPELAKYAFKLFLLAPDETVTDEYHPFGSWKDVKNLYGMYGNTPLVEYGSELLLTQLNKDVVSEKPSLAAKWVPREKSEHGKLFTILATYYFSDYIKTAKNEDKKKKATIKAKMEFRKLVSSLNKRLDTVQIKQCGRTWAEIEPTKQTSITMHKQKRAFLNVTKKGEERYKDDDRIVCAEKFKLFIEKAVKGEVQIKGKRVGLNSFTEEAFKILNEKQEKTDVAKILNAQWLDNSTQTGKLGKMIAMVDVSGSMTGDPMNAAIALGIRVAEKSILGKRVMTFSEHPTWVNLTGENDYISMVDVVRKAPWGMNTNFASALKMILDAIVSQKLTTEDVEDMVLAIFSDMQMDQADRNSKSLMQSIENEYAIAGIKVWGKPYKPPHILFWNLSSTTGFPSLSTQTNASMMSGFSPALLNMFCEEGLDAFKDCTPWSIFTKSLENERYKPLDTYLRNTLVR